MLRARESASVFAALGDETRFRIVARLSKDGPASITGLTSEFEITRQAVTKHLRVLEAAGLVRGSRPGRTSAWELQPRKLAQAKESLDRISADWDSALERLRYFVESK